MGSPHFCTLPMLPFETDRKWIGRFFSWHMDYYITSVAFAIKKSPFALQCAWEHLLLYGANAVETGLFPGECRRFCPDRGSFLHKSGNFFCNFYKSGLTSCGMTSKMIEKKRVQRG